MIFVQFFDYIGLHIPALGAFIVCFLVVTLVCFLFYKWGAHEANKRWIYQVEKMPAVIGQDVREKYAHKLIELTARIKYLQERNDSFEPAFKALTVIANKFVEESKP